VGLEHLAVVLTLERLYLGLELLDAVLERPAALTELLDALLTALDLALDALDSLLDTATLALGRAELVALVLEPLDLPADLVALLDERPPGRSRLRSPTLPTRVRPSSEASVATRATRSPPAGRSSPCPSSVVPSLSRLVVG